MAVVYLDSAGDVGRARACSATAFTPRRACMARPRPAAVQQKGRRFPLGDVNTTHTPDPHPIFTCRRQPGRPLAVQASRLHTQLRWRIRQGLADGKREGGREGWRQGGGEARASELHALHTYIDIHTYIHNRRLMRELHHCYRRLAGGRLAHWGALSELGVGRGFVRLKGWSLRLLHTVLCIHTYIQTGASAFIFFFESLYGWRSLLHFSSFASTTANVPAALMGHVSCNIPHPCPAQVSFRLSPVR